MVETQIKNQNVFWLWSDEVDCIANCGVLHWMPVYVELDKKLTDELKSGRAKKLRDIAFIDYGFMPLEDYTTPALGKALIRVTNIKGDGIIEMEDIKYVPINDRVHEKLVKEGDSLIVQCGNTTGKIGFITKELEGLVYPSFCLLARPTKINPYALNAILSSSVVQTQLKRGMDYSSVRPNTTKPEVENLIIPILTNLGEQEIEQTAKNAFRLKKEAVQEYQEAITLLETTLKFSDSNQMVFTRWSNEIDFVERLDVGYWQQPTIKVSGTKLSEVASVNTGKQYAVYENAESEVEFISIKDFENLYVGEADRFVLKNDVIEKTRITKGDILLAVTGATIGKVGIFNRPQAVVSADVAIIRSKTLKPNFLGALIQSRYGKSLIDKYTYGATNKHLDIKGFSGNFIVPQIDKKIADKVSNLLDSSSKHREESRRKLQEAKDFVENLVKKD